MMREVNGHASQPILGCFSDAFRTFFGRPLTMLPGILCLHYRTNGPQRQIATIRRIQHAFNKKQHC